MDVSQTTPDPVALEVTAQEETADGGTDVDPGIIPSCTSAELQPCAKSVAVKEEEMNQINRIGSLAITAPPSNPTPPPTLAGQKRCASADPERECIVDEEANDAARLAALKVCLICFIFISN